MAIRISWDLSLSKQMGRPLFSWLSGFFLSLRVWGLWPCWIMISSQWVAAWSQNRVFPWRVTLLTLAGTASMYGADRMLERRHQVSTALRHQRVPFWDGFFILIILLLVLPILPHLTRELLIWLLVLGLAGAAYLLVTVRLVLVPILTKELLGAFCFTYLVWGILPLDPGTLCAFYLLSIANFLWSSDADRIRDQANQLKSMACSFPALNRALARVSALSAALLFFLLQGHNALFAWVALAHALWPKPKSPFIDLAFAPLVLILVPYFFWGESF